MLTVGRRLPCLNRPSDLVARLLRMYAEDPALGQALARAKGLRESPAMAAMSAAEGASGSSPVGAGRQAVLALFKKAAEFAAQPQGPQAVVLEMGGWGQPCRTGRPAGRSGQQSGPCSIRVWLNCATGSAAPAKATLGRARRCWLSLNLAVKWPSTARSAPTTERAVSALVLGGAVRGGLVLADWPGLAKHQRHEGRDLRITTDLRAVFKALLGGASARTGRFAWSVRYFPEVRTSKRWNLLRT